MEMCASHCCVMGNVLLLTVVLLFSFHIDETARPNPFGMPGIVPPYVPPQMLNIPQTSLQAKPVVRPFLSFLSWSAQPWCGTAALKAAYASNLDEC